MASSRWTFHDPTGSIPTDYSFSVNPITDSPQYQKNLQFQAITIPGAAPLLYEGQDQPTVFSVTGDILMESQYTALVQWYNLRHQILLTDDVGRQRYIYLTNFQPVRKKSATYPWRHTYTLSGYILSETFPVILTPSPITLVPTVTSLSPSMGTYVGGTSVVVTGTDFTGASIVLFGGVPCPFTVTSGTSLTVTAPSGAPMASVHVQVVNASVTSVPTPADLYTFVGPPTLTSISPNRGPDTGGQGVLLTGTGFLGTSVVQFGVTDAASFVVLSDTQISAITPAEADGGVDINITTLVGSASLSSPPSSPSFVNGQANFLPADGLTITITTPGSLVVGNKLLAIIYGGDATAYSPPPTGWTLLAKANEDTTEMMAAYWRDVDGTETPNYTFSVNTSPGWMAGAICQYANTLTGTAGFDGTPTFDGSFRNVSSGTVPAITATLDDLWVGAVGTFNGVTISTPPSGFTQEVTISGAGDDGITVWDSSVSAGVNGPVSWVFDSSGVDEYGSVSVLLAGTPAGAYLFVPPPLDMMLLMPSPQENDG